MFVGLNSYFEHPSIAFIENSKLLFAAEDERFTGLKGGKSYNPFHAYVPLAALFEGLCQTGRTAQDIQKIGFSYDPFQHLGSLWGCFTGARLSSFSEEFGAFFSALRVKELLGTEYGYRPEYEQYFSPQELSQVPFSYFDHHLCHAASAFFLSGFDEAVIITADGAGEKTTARVSLGSNSTIRTIVNHKLPNSLGHLYSFVTKHLGFRPFSDEYKVMGLAAYGKDEYAKAFAKLLELQPDGRFKVNLALAGNLSNILGPPRLPSQEIQERHQNIANSLQRALEKAIIHIAQDAQTRTGQKHACFAGGVFMNSVANGLLAASGIFEKTFFMPAASDAGTAIGAACLLHAKENPRSPQIEYPGMFLGTSYSDLKILNTINGFDGLVVERFDEDRLAEEAAELLAQGHIGATFRGCMEFGDRALGNRSILADPQIPEIIERLNTVKGREMFRPLAPITLKKRVGEYFEGQGNEFMMTTCKVKAERRSQIAGCVHVDGSARVQVVDEESHPFIARLLSEFAKRKGYPVLINTSFNLHGQPMIESPRQALVALSSSVLSFVVMNNFLVKKLERHAEPTPRDHQNSLRPLAYANRVS
jgi:carbamoyltransferase